MVSKFTELATKNTSNIGGVSTFTRVIADSLSFKDSTESGLPSLKTNVNTSLDTRVSQTTPATLSEDARVPTIENIASFFNPTRPVDVRPLLGKEPETLAFGGGIVQGATFLASRIIEDLFVNFPLSLIGAITDPKGEKKLTAPISASRLGSELDSDFILNAGLRANLRAEELDEERPEGRFWNVAQAVAEEVLPPVLGVVDFGALTTAGARSILRQSLNPELRRAFDTLGIQSADDLTEQALRENFQTRLKNVIRNGVEQGKNRTEIVSELNQLGRSVSVISKEITGEGITTFNRFGNTLEKVSRQALRVPEPRRTPALGTRGALPGFRPKGGRVAPRVGLQTDPLEPVGREARRADDLEALRRANPLLFRRAERAKTADDFVDAVVKADKTTRDRVSVPVLTDFFNRVKDTTDDLAAEAQDFIRKNPKATAEEFVEAQPKVFHGTKKEIKEFSKDFLGENQQADFGDGISFTDSRSIAKSFAKEAGGDTVMEVRIDLKNPARNKDLLDPEIQNAIDDEFFGSLEDVLKKKGFDGIEFTHIDGSKEFVVYDLNKIKTKSQLIEEFNKVRAKVQAPTPLSEIIRGGKLQTRPATHRDGTERFNTANDYINEHADTKPSIREQEETTRRISGIKSDGTTVASEQGIVPPIKNTPQKARSFSNEKNTPFEIPEETRLKYITRQIQDKMHTLEDVQKSIEKTGKAIPENEDAYLQQELFIGRGSEKVAELRRRIIKAPPKSKDKAMLQRMIKDGISVEDIGFYLHARTAPERNARVAEINPDIPDGGSGMTNAEAAQIMKRFSDEGKIELLEKYGKEFDETIINPMKQEMVDSGLESQKTKEILDSAYKYYAPLKVDKSSPLSIGKGFSISGKNIHSVKGSTRGRMNPFLQAIADYENILVKGEKNKAAQAFKKLVEENPQKDLWEIEKLRFTPRFDETGEIVRFDPKFKFGDNIIEVREEGEIFLITIKDDTVVGRELAKAMKNMGTERGIKFLTASNMYLRSVITVYNPEFMISNFERDFQFALARFAGERGLKAAGQLAKNTPLAMRGVWSNVRGGEHFIGNDGTDWTALYQEFKDQGARIGFFDLKEMQDKLNDMAKLTNTWGSNTASAKAKQFVSSIGTFVESANEAAESSVRLAAYKAGLDSGMTKAKSAQLAKNLTINFNKKGNLGILLDSLWLFANAGIQGNMAMLKSLKRPIFRKVALGIAAAAYGLNEMNRAINEREFNKIATHEFEANWIIMTPEGNRIALANGYGIGLFKNLGDEIYNQVHGRKTVAESLVGLISSVDRNFNPLSSGTLSQFISPTLADPFIQIGENKNFFGGPIRPPEPVFAPGKPESERYWGTVRTPTRELAQWLNRATGGSVTESGFVDVSPENIDHMVDFLGGGVGKFIANTVHTGTTLIQGELPEIENIPFVRKVFKTPFEKFDRFKLRELEEKSELQQLNQNDREVLQSVIKDGLQTEQINMEEATDSLKRIERNQARITAGRVFDEIKNATPEEKQEAIKSLNELERKEFFKIIDRKIEQEEL